MPYQPPDKPALRGSLSSEQIRNEFGKIATELGTFPAPLGGGLRGFNGGQWDSGTINAATLLRSQVGTNVGPSNLIADYIIMHASDGYGTLGVGNLGWTRGGDGRLKLLDADRIRLFSDNGHNLVMGSGATENATSASTGFFYINTTNGVATGAPTSYVGAVPMTYDRAANKIGIYNGGAWKWTAALA